MSFLNIRGYTMQIRADHYTDTSIDNREQLHFTERVIESYEMNVEEMLKENYHQVWQAAHKDCSYYLREKNRKQ